VLRNAVGREGGGGGVKNSEAGRGGGVRAEGTGVTVDMGGGDNAESAAKDDERVRGRNCRSIAVCMLDVMLQRCFKALGPRGEGCTGGLRGEGGGAEALAGGGGGIMRVERKV